MKWHFLLLRIQRYIMIVQPSISRVNLHVEGALLLLVAFLVSLMHRITNFLSCSCACLSTSRRCSLLQHIYKTDFIIKLEEKLRSAKRNCKACEVHHLLN